MAKANGQAVSRTTQRYQKLREASTLAGEKADCGVIALAVICNVSYKKAHATLKRCGRKVGQGTTDWKMRKAFDLLGYRIVRKLRKSDDPNGCRTLRTIEDSDAVDGGCWLIHVADHWVGMTERTIHDHTVGRMLRVKSAIKIVKTI